MEFNFDNERPIYKQIMEKIEINILTNVYDLGEKLPSVRDFALELKVNPNTVQRALNELETQGLITTMRTNGKFVTEDSKVLEDIKNQLAKERSKLYLEQMSQIGFSKEQAIKIIKGE